MPVIPSLSPPLLSGAPAWRSLGDVTLTLKQHLERGTPTGLPRPAVHDRSSKAHFHSYVIWWFNQSQLCACYSWARRFLGRPVLVNISCSVRISDTLLLPIFAEERSKQATKDYMCRICPLSPLNSSSVSHSQHPSRSLSLAHCVKPYLVSFGPPQRKEAGEEELAPADDGSQAPVEASHACVCPVLSASLLSL